MTEDHTKKHMDAYFARKEYAQSPQGKAETLAKERAKGQAFSNLMKKHRARLANDQHHQSDLDAYKRHLKAKNNGQ